ncbi:MAG: hypothetical protein BRD46_05890, partial [Bacteroidetes bacterium QS_8_68_15]
DPSATRPSASDASAALPARSAAFSGRADSARADTTRPPPPDRYATTGLSRTDTRATYERALSSARGVRSSLTDQERSLTWTKRKADNYQVEIYKKSSMAVACFLFVLIGIPLGLTLGSGSLGRAGAIALSIFLFYWVTLVLGEKAADRAVLPPWLGMWAANIVMLVVGAWLMSYVALDLGATPSLRHRLWRVVKRWKVEG